MSGNGFIGTFASVSVLEAKFPAAKYEGRAAHIESAGKTVEWFSDGVSWRPAVVFTTDVNNKVTGFMEPSGNSVGFVKTIKNIGLQNPAPFTVTGTTSAQTIELCDLTNLLGVGDTVEIRATFGYTASTNSKTISLGIGTASPGVNMLSTVRNTATEASLELLYRFSVSSESGIVKQPSAFTGSSNTAIAVEQATDWANAKLYCSLTLASAGESVGLFGYSVIVLKSR